MDLRHVPRLVWVLAAGRFLSSTSSYTMLFLTLYLTGPRDLSVTTAGLVVGGTGVGLLLGSFTGGYWGDRFGHRPVLLLASTIGGLGTVAIPWAPTWTFAVGMPVLWYLGATQGVSTGALAALAVDRGDRRTSIAISRAANPIGFSDGAVAASINASRAPPNASSGESSKTGTRPRRNAFRTSVRSAPDS